MPKFLITYTAGAQPGDMSDEMSQQVMEAWNKWYADLGDAVVDFGNPTGDSRTIIPGGVVQDGTSGITGYSLIEVDSLDAAAEACRNHPHLEDGGTITVHETFEVGPQS